MYNLFGTEPTGIWTGAKLKQLMYPFKKLLKYLIGVQILAAKDLLKQPYMYKWRTKVKNKWRTKVKNKC